MRFHLRSTVAAGAVALGLAAAPAAAQDNSANAGTAAAQDDGTGLGDIIVTAQKRSENVQKVPIAISAVGSQYLESRGITSIDALGSIAPNVKIERAPSNKTAAQIAIRGSVTINPAITWEPAVGLYLDGVYIAKVQGSIFDIADLERVEVLRGPQGTLYGRNSLAGAINLVTKKPSGEFGGRAEISYGNFDLWRAKASLDLPALGPLAVKLSGQIQKRDGTIKVVPNPYPQAFLARPNSVDSTNDLNGQSFMAQARLNASDNFTVDYTFDYNRNKQRPDYAQLVNVLPNSLWTDPAQLAAIAPLGLYAHPDRQNVASLNGSPLLEYSRSTGHALTATLDLGAATIKSITSYRKLKWDDFLDLDGSPLDIAYTSRQTKFRAFSQELQASGETMGESLKYVVGLFYYNEKAETLGPQHFFGFLDQLNVPGAAHLQSDYGGHTKAWAAYAQLDYKIADPLTLTLGARYTHERKDVRRYFNNNAGFIFNLPYGGVPDAKYNNFSPAVTLAYQATPNINLYGRWARGFKSGGFNGETNDLFTNCPSISELCTPYRPEKVNSYELGAKTRLLDGTLILNLAGFWDDHKDIQLSIFRAAGAASSIVKNAAASRIRGLELEAIAKPANWLTVNGSFALLDAKYKRFIDGGVDVSDNRAFPHTPKYTANLGVDWRVLEGDWGKFNITGDMNFVSKYYTFPYALRGNRYVEPIAGNTQSQGRTIVNMRAALSELKLGGAELELAAWVKNLTKENNAQNFIDFGAGFGGLTVGYFPDPRTYGLTLGAKF